MSAVAEIAFVAGLVYILVLFAFVAILIFDDLRNYFNSVKGDNNESKR